MSFGSLRKGQISCPTPEDAGALDRIAEERQAELREAARKKREEAAARKKQEAEEKKKARAEAKFKADAPARKKVSELLKDDVWKQRNAGLQRSAAETAAELRRVLGAPSQQKSAMQKLCDMAWDVNTPDWKTNCLPLAHVKPPPVPVRSPAPPQPAPLTKQQYDYLKANAATLRPEQRTISLAAPAGPPTQHFGSTSTFRAPIAGRVDAKVATDNLPYGVLARDVDMPNGAAGPLFGFQQTADWKQFMQGKVGREEIKRFEQAGFYARVYQNARTGEVVVAFRSSTPLRGDPMSDRWRDDWTHTNVPQRFGATTPQYTAAETLTRLVKERYSRQTVTLTGFSKGGGQASFAGGLVDKVVTFDGARHPDSTRGINPNQVNIIVRGDPVGDPDAGVRATLAGAGRLPGNTYTVESTEPRLLGGLYIGDRTQTHSIDGILGGMLDAAGGRYRP